MWNFASKCLAGTGGLRFRDRFRKLTQCVQESSDDEASSIISKEDGLECPICCESFNIVENTPYVLWCGHSLCKNCVLALPWATVKIHPVPVRLPLLISCPWCNLLSPRLVLKVTLKFPRKNYFLLWMVERMNTDKVKVDDCHQSKLTSSDGQTGQSSVPAVGASRVVGIHRSIRKAVFFLVELTAKFPLVLIFLLIVLYAIPASAAILPLYVLLTVLFALPSFLVLYFSYPSLDWLVREIMG
ncbi:hypothetical protein L1987_74959 [Smallanthus sonchifolius]|uniref:Uncharacterized protein n=1 Tax=Smallanthus sonchifolius TaxID=185202 RepID=A0ACB9A3M1_9ASTR|nr:hypothetical protein L1987_74959 [Smallanthus sonchifolius]